jgi:hypothetical protein
MNEFRFGWFYHGSVRLGMNTDFDPRTSQFVSVCEGSWGRAVGATDAERARRSRRHRQGDHSLCDPSRCDGVTPVTSQPREAPRPRKLGARGSRLWQEEGGDGLAGARRVVLEEACRLVDRLDRLDAIVNGRDRAWLTLELAEDGLTVEVVVDKLLSESRQQQLALKQLAAELRQGASADKPAAGGGALDQLAARRAARLANAAG